MWKRHHPATSAMASNRSPCVPLYLLALRCSGVLRSRRQAIWDPPAEPAVCYRCDNYQELIDGKQIVGRRQGQLIGAGVRVRFSH